MRVGKFHEENSASFLFLMAYWFFFLKKKERRIGRKEGLNDSAGIERPLLHLRLLLED